ncbi:hypothetical protein CRG98_035237 [Punica granatum]|nr:hypothetical protein CRG98_035237 [Punica granatum]
MESIDRIDPREGVESGMQEQGKTRNRGGEWLKTEGRGGRLDQHGEEWFAAGCAQPEPNALVAAAKVGRRDYTSRKLPKRQRPRNEGTEQTSIVLHSGI